MGNPIKIPETKTQILFLMNCLAEFVGKPEDTANKTDPKTN